MELTKLADHSQLKQIYDRALNSDPTNLISFVDIQLAYFQYRRRHYEEQATISSTQLDSLKEEIRHICEYACDQYQELFSSINPNLFLKYNAQLELFWIHLELKSFHSIEHARKVLYRALNHIQTMDYPLIICEILLEHEKKYGNIQQLKETKDRLREVKRKIIPVEKPKRQQQANVKKGKQKNVKEKPTKASNNQMDTSKN
jgi:hypothetical protein